MARIEKSIEIHVPPTEVWAYLSVPENFIKWGGTLDKVEIIHETSDGVGTQARATLGYMKFILEVVELVEQCKIVAHAIDGDLDHLQQSFHLALVEGGTRLTYMIDYKVPAVLGGRILDRLLVQRTINEEMARGLQRLKHYLERTWSIQSKSLNT